MKIKIHVLSGGKIRCETFYFKAIAIFRQPTYVRITYEMFERNTCFMWGLDWEKPSEARLDYFLSYVWQFWFWSSAGN